MAHQGFIFAKILRFKRPNLPGKRRNLTGNRGNLPWLGKHPFSISKFEVFQAWYTWQTMGAHNAHNQIERSGSDFFDTGTVAPMGFLVLSSFVLFHTILATCSSHTGMSCRLFSRWFGASSRHQQYPTVLALESQLGIRLLGHDSGMIFQGHFSCSRKLPGAFYFSSKGLKLCTHLAQVDIAGRYHQITRVINNLLYWVGCNYSTLW